MATVDGSPATKGGADPDDTFTDEFLELIPRLVKILNDPPKTNFETELKLALV